MPLRIAVVGMSLRATCGVRDHARLLAGELERREIACSFHWLTRSRASLPGARSEISAWRGELARELEHSRPDVILLHYSVFSLSYKGVPLFVRPTLATLRAARVPVITVLHELAYPWHYGGPRGGVWAVSQRALLVPVVRASAGIVVTAAERSAWLASRRWLPTRPVLVAPVFSNLPPPAAAARAPHGSAPIGLFGYSYEGSAVALVLDALAHLRAGDDAVQLKLLGAPGAGSAAGRAWLAGARERNVQGALSFSGALPAQALSDALAACELLLCADAAGPSSRKGTLAGSLASGRPVVAIDGPMSWPELIQSGAVRLVAPSARALADALAGLLADESARAALGDRGRAFYDREMAVGRTADAVQALAERTVPARGAAHGR